METKEKRINAGYEIIYSRETSKRHEYVIGHRATAPAPFVVWDCLDGDNYFTGRYCGTETQARRILANLAKRDAAAGIIW